MKFMPRQSQRLFPYSFGIDMNYFQQAIRKFKPGELAWVCLTTALACLASLTLVCEARAQVFDAVRLYGVKSAESGGSVGMGVAFVPKYMGTKDHVARPLPLLEYRWSNGLFAGTGNGLGYNFGGQGRAQFGPRLTLDLGRKESDDKHLAGLGDIKVKPELGVFFNYEIVDGLQATSSLRFGSGNQRRGAIADLGLSYTYPVAADWLLGMGVAMSVVNADYISAYFGVDASQAARSGLARYSPTAGVRDARGNLVLSYSFSRRLGASFGLSAGQLLSEAKQSPLVRQTSSLSAFSGVTYLF